jgi:hypothetical protein
VVEAGVSYFSSRDLRHAKADLDEMVAAGCSYVVHCVTETDLLYHRQAVAGIIAATKEAGLEAWVDPWGLTGIFSGETLSRFLVDHPEALQLRSDGVRSPAACPNHPETRRFLLDWVSFVAEAGAEVTFWDEPHFDIPLWHGDWSGAWACRCVHCQERFRAFAGGPVPERMDDQVRAFRERSLIDLLAELSAASRKLGMRNCLCLLPVDPAGAGLPELAERQTQRLRRRMEQAGGDPADPDPAASVGIRDWEAAASIPNLDVFGTDPYWLFQRADPEQYVRAYTRRTVDTAKRRGIKDVQIWVQAFSVPEGQEDDLALGLRTAVDEGATHVAAWSFRATETMSIRCARPEVAWGVVSETFRELRERSS